MGAFLAIGGLIGALILPQQFSDAASTGISTIYKTGTNLSNGSTAASSDAPGGAKTGTAKSGDTIKWVVPYQNNTNASASVNVKDLVTDWQTYVDGSLQLPPSQDPAGQITPQYTTNGGSSWASGTPPANANGVGFTGTMVPPGTQQRSGGFTTTSNASTLQLTSGDTYNVVTRNGLVYGVYHHRSGAVVFCVRQNNTTCPGWPTNSIAQTWSETVGAAIGTGTSFDGVTAWQGGTWIHNNRLLWLVGRSNNTASGVACLDLAPTTPTSCGFFPILNSSLGNAEGASIGSTGIRASNGNVYVVAQGSSNAYLLCVAPDGKSTCGTRILLSGVSLSGSITVASFGDYVFPTVRANSSSTWKTYCYQASTLSACTGSWPVDSQPAYTGSGATIAPILSTSGAVTGVCSFPNPEKCWNLNGSTTTKTYDGWLRWSILYSAGDVFVVGTKVYGALYDSVLCRDFAQPLSKGLYVEPCVGFSNPSNIDNYTVRSASDIAPNCLVATGDAGQITFFNAISGGACLTNSQVNTLSVTPSTYYCGSGSAGFRGWGTLTLPGLVSGTYTNSSVTLRDQNNNVISGFQNVTVAAGGSLNLSSIPTSVTRITADVTVNGVNDPSGVSSGRIAISWVGDPPQMCFQTKVPTLVCDLSSYTISNSANAVTTSSGGSDAPGGNSTGAASFTVQQTGPACSLGLTKVVKSTQLSNPPKAGDTVTYTFEAKNTSNVTLTNVRIDDPLPLSGHIYTWPGTAGVLDPGQSLFITATHSITQAEINAGHVANTATASGTTPRGANVPATPASTDTSLRQYASLELKKTASTTRLSSPPKVGEPVVYTYSGTNLGNVTLTNVQLDDKLPLYGHVYSWPGAVGVLQPGQTYTVTAYHNITQAEIDAGHIANTVTGAAKEPSGAAHDVWPKSTDTPLVQTPSLTLSKTANATKVSNPAKVGDPITYTYTATNTGNVTLTNVQLDDKLPLYGHVITWPGASGTLLPGQTLTIVAMHNLTQAEIDAGHVANTATGSATGPNGSNVPATPKSTDTPVVQKPELTLAKTASTTQLSNPAKVGDKISYTYTATNTGNVTLTNVIINDPLPLQGVVVSWPGVTGTLAPGQTYTVTAFYTLTQADLDAGHVANTVTGSAKGPGGSSVPATPKSTDTPVVQNPALTLAKTADASNVASPAKIGDTITYTITVANTGNVTVTGVRVSDALPGLVLQSTTWPGSAGTLLPGQTVKAVYTYRLTQADIDAGHVTNTATATGTSPGGGKVDTPPGTTDTPLAQAPGLTVVKTADETKLSNPAKLGDRIDYTFVATNTGNVVLTAVTIDDPLVGVSQLVYVWPGAPGTLAPGQSVSATATYTVKQADLDAGHVENTAVAGGTTPSGGTTTSPPSTVDTPLSPEAAIVLEKRADATQVHTPAQLGDVVTFTFIGTNTGRSTLTEVTLVDRLPGLSQIVITWPGAPGVLRAGESLTATATYALTQADVDAGHLSNAAAITGKPPAGEPVSGESTVDVPVQGAPAISLEKKADVSQVQTPAKPGDIVTFTLIATNTGTVTLTQVSIADALQGLSVLTYSWPGPAGTLQPGQAVTATATYALTQKELDDGHLSNAATVSGTPGTGQPVTDESTVDVPVAGEPPIQLSEVVWHKIDETAAKNVLAGAEWTFTPVDPDGNPTAAAVVVADCVQGIGVQCAGPDVDPIGGVFRLTAVAPGRYQLVETRAPIGFVLDSTPIMVTVGATSSTVTLPDVVNKQQPAPVIPFTGGLGTDALTFSGVGLLLAFAGLAGWQLLRRRRTV